MLDNVCASIDVSGFDILGEGFDPNNANIHWATDTCGRIFTFFDKDSDDLVELSEDELDKKCYSQTSIIICSGSTERTYMNDNGFTVRELLDYVLEVETIERPKSEWFGGVDVHHVYFEGLYLQKDEHEDDIYDIGQTKKFYVSWGS